MSQFTIDFQDNRAVVTDKTGDHITLVYDPGRKEVYVSDDE